MKTLATALLAAATALLSAAPALADTATYSLTTTNPFVVPGNTVTFNGIITAPTSNTGAITLLGDTYDVDSPLILDDTDFFVDTPLTLSPGGSYTGPLFTITLPSSTFAGTYNGFFDVIFLDSSSNQFQDNATFQVTATPEPGSWLLLSTGIAGVAALRRRYARA